VVDDFFIRNIIGKIKFLRLGWTYKIKTMNLKVIAFDADDTLWVNEPYFLEVEQKFCELLSPYLSHHTLSQELFKTEIENLRLYGYGIKGYILSMIEAALQISNHTISPIIISKIIDYGKELLEKPIELLSGVQETLEGLKGEYKIILATKGDLLDQHRKLHNSGLGHYFHHIEVMSDKKEIDYEKLLQRLDIQPQDFMMVGNSLKSDILPVLAIGAKAIYIPFHTTWAHEKVEYEVKHENLKSVQSIVEVLNELK
jgi:putative hydrolase of the HAD superfamily